LLKDPDTGTICGRRQRKQVDAFMSETARVCGEYGVGIGEDAALAKIDRDILMDALRHYGEHLLITATTVRMVKPLGADRRAVSAHLEVVSARANLLANMVDSAKGVTLYGCGEG
jgi:hypothetical protein